MNTSVASTSNLISGLTPMTKVSHYFKLGQNPCPVFGCGKKDKGCAIHESGDIVICMTVASDDPVGWGMGGYRHRLKAKGYKPLEIIVPQRKRKTSEKTYEMDSPEIRHQGYSHLLKKWGGANLSDEHKAWLISKGVKDVSGYISIPKPIREDFRHPFPEGIKGKIPGKLAADGKRWINGIFYGLGFVMKNLNGLYTGVEIRLDEQSKIDAMEYFRGKNIPYPDLPLGKSVYRPLNSNNLPGGAKLTEFCACMGDIRKTDTIYLTEGLRKAQILYESTGVPVLTVRGVSNWHKLFMFAMEAQRLNKGIKTVKIAFDMDRTNVSGKHANVKKSYEDLCKALQDEMTFEVVTLEWDAKDKGIDDALLAGQEIKEIYHNNAITIGLDEARSQCYEKINDAIKNLDGKFHLMKVTPGVGKTHTLIMAINQLHNEGNWPQVQNGTKTRDARIVLLMDNKKLINEHLPLFDFPVIPVEGRTDDDGSRFYCANYEAVAEVAKAGKNTFKMMCQSCPLQETCTYLKSTRDLLNKKFIMSTKASFFNNSDRLNNVDLVIMDESVEDSFKLESKLSKQDVINNIEVFTRVIKRLEKMSEERLFDYYKESMTLLDRNPFEQRERDLKNHHAHLEQLKDLLTLMETERTESYHANLQMFPMIEYPDVYKFNDWGKDLKVKGHISDGIIHVYPRNIFGGFGKPDFYIEVDGSLTIKDLDHRSINCLRGKTVINLDATPLSFTRLIGDENLITHDLQVKQQIKVWEIRNAQYSKLQLRDEKYQNEVIKLINHTVKKYGKGNVGVMSTKEAFENIVTKSNADINLCGYHGRDSKGTNRMKNVKVLIQIGAYIKNLEAVKRDAALLRKNEIEITAEQHCEEVTFAEMTQSYSRGRPSQRSEDDALIIIKVGKKQIAGMKPEKIFGSIDDAINDFSSVEKHKQILQKKVEKTMSNLQGSKTGSNPVIAENDPPIKIYPKISGQPPRGGSEIIQPCWRVTRSRLNQESFAYLRSVSDKVKNVSANLFKKFLDVLQEGWETYSEIATQLNISESTAKRLRRAVSNLIHTRDGLPLIPPETPQDEQEMGQEAIAVAAHAREEYFDYLIAEYEERFGVQRNFRSFYSFYQKYCARIRDQANGMDKKLQEALMTIRDYPDHEHSFDWFWMVYFEVHAGSLVKEILKEYPWILIEWLCIETEKDGQIEC